MKRLKNILKIIAINFLIFVICLIVIEIIFGGWFNASRLNRLNMLKNCVLQYDVSNLYIDPNPIITYSRDKYGLRGTYTNPSEIDILTVGGSTTDQRFIRNGETWQDILQKKFNEAGMALFVANAGIDGQSTYGHIKNFEWWFPYVPNLRPKYILFYIGSNDFYKKAGLECDGFTDSRQSYTLETRIRQNSALWHMIRTIRGAYVAIVVEKIKHRFIDFSKEHWTHKALQGNYVFMETRLNEYANRLRILADKTYSIGAKPIFVSQPSRRYQITSEGILGHNSVNFYDGKPYNGVDFYHMMKKLNNVTKSVADEKKAFFVDLASQTIWDNSDFYDYTHMTPKGTKKVGNLLHDALKTIIPCIVAESGS